MNKHDLNALILLIISNSIKNKSKKYDLHIYNDNGFYTLRWFFKQELKYVGTGMVHGKSLIAGWKKY